MECHGHQGEPPTTKASPDLYRILAPYFTVGILVEKVTRVVKTAPPIVKYMVGWRYGQVEDYCRKKHWKIEAVPEKIN